MKTNYFLKAATFIMLLTFNQYSFGQVQGYWNLVGTANPTLQNIPVSGSNVIREFQVLTNSNTRVRVFNDGIWQINPWSGAGGYISTPSGQADYATFKIRAGGTSGLVSYSFQNRDWGQNIQSYVGRAYTVSYAVKWNGSDRFYVAGQGWLYANGAWFDSDRKLKENIKPLENSLEKVLKLNGYSYRFKPEKRCADCDSTTSPVTDGKTEIGLMADEVELVVPEVVRTIDNDNKKAIAYQNLVALLIESTKEQQKIINHLQSQVTIIIVFCGILFLVILVALVFCRKIIKTSLTKS
jgi:hypothetical protein